MNTSTPQPFSMPLAQLKRGQTARVESASLERDDADLIRAMGLRPSATVRMCRLGQPCIVEVCDSTGPFCRIGLARDLASRVMVCPAG